MGVWAEIKHALNNTLGTTSFKPLNTIVTEQATAIKNLVTSETTGVETHVTNKTNEVLNQLYNSKSLLASDEVFYTFPDALSGYYRYTDASYNIALCNFTMPLSGSVNLSYEIGLATSATNGTTIKIVINKNGSEYFSYASSYRFGESANPARTLRLDGVRGDVFEIRAIYTHKLGTGSKYTSYLSLYSLNATVKDSETINLQTLI